MIEIVVNGQKRRIAAEATVADLLAELGLKRDGIAVAIDREVVPKTAHDTTRLASGAAVEVIRAVGGG